LQNKIKTESENIFRNEMRKKDKIKVQKIMKNEYNLEKDMRKQGNCL